MPFCSFLGFTKECFPGASQAFASVCGKRTGGMGLDEVNAFNAGIQPLKGLTNSSGNLDVLNCKFYFCLFIAHNLLIVLYIFFVHQVPA